MFYLHLREDLKSDLLLVELYLLIFKVHQNTWSPCMELLQRNFFDNLLKMLIAENIIKVRRNSFFTYETFILMLRYQDKMVWWITFRDWKNKYWRTFSFLHQFYILSLIKNCWNCMRFSMVIFIPDHLACFCIFLFKCWLFYNLS